MADWQTHEVRATELSDAIRRYLAAIHTGGIAVTFALAVSLADSGIPPGWAFLPVILFTCGLAMAGVSLFLAQRREFRRRDALLASELPPSFRRGSWDWGWNAASLAVFAAAVLFGLWSLGAYIAE